MSRVTTVGKHFYPRPSVSFAWVDRCWLVVVAIQYDDGDGGIRSVLIVAVPEKVTFHASFILH